MDSQPIVHVITGLGDGGAEGVLYRLCKHDPRERHVVVSLMEGGRYETLLREIGVEVHSLGLKRGRLGPGAVMRLVQDQVLTLPEAVATVTRNPARAAGMADRGELAAGLRADLVQVHMAPLPDGQVQAVVRGVWREGLRVL